MATYILANRGKKPYVPDYAYVDQYLPQNAGGSFGAGTRTGWMNSTGQGFAYNDRQGMAATRSANAYDYRKARLEQDLQRVNATADAMRKAGLDPSTYMSKEIQSIYNQPKSSFGFAEKGDQMKAGYKYSKEYGFLSNAEMDTMKKAAINKANIDLMYLEAERKAKLANTTGEEGSVTAKKLAQGEERIQQGQQNVDNTTRRTDVYVKTVEEKAAEKKLKEQASLDFSILAKTLTPIQQAEYSKHSANVRNLEETAQDAANAAIGAVDAKAAILSDIAESHAKGLALRETQYNKNSADDIQQQIDEAEAQNIALSDKAMVEQLTRAGKLTDSFARTKLNSNNRRLARLRSELAAIQPAESAQPEEGTEAVNELTGETLVFRNGTWEPK